MTAFEPCRKINDKAQQIRLIQALQVSQSGGVEHSPSDSN
jgi:hypothetical protein